MSLYQLNPPIPLYVADRGKGMAMAVIDYGPEHNLIWVTAIDATGEIWCAPNPKVRMQANWSLMRDVSEPERKDKLGTFMKNGSAVQNSAEI